MICQGPKKMHTAKCLFAECQNKGTQQTPSLPSAKKKAIGKDKFCRVPKKTLGKIHLCQVPEKRHSAETNFVECFFLPSVFYLALGKDRLCRVPDKIHSAKPPALGKSPVSGSARCPYMHVPYEPTNKCNPLFDAIDRIICYELSNSLVEMLNRPRATKY